MSLNSKELKGKYNRSKSASDSIKEQASEEDSLKWDEYFDFLYGAEEYYHTPSMAEVRQGLVFTILAKLGLQSAKKTLSGWYW
jgi:hypothetical protein